MQGGNIPLSTAAAYVNDTRVIKKLIAEGSDTNSTNNVRLLIKFVVAAARQC